ncbi:hypothetical protein TNCT_35891 [Trichonephila clavata]|uniref:Uncharacterized protein n=1 Tax=Trichonephila clavata TaxID=2740835 RepID=A0A8X6GQQ9_TRICU|nr:hypothetical protein TNCT_35891 [Trichonephila clavata]
MDRNMRAAVFSPIRNKSFEDHKQSDELPACNISKYLKGPAAFKENLQKTSGDVTSRKNKKTSGSGLQKSLDKASEHKTKDTSKKLRIKRDIFASSPEFNATVSLPSTVEDLNEHLDCSSNTEVVIKNKKSQQKNSKHDQNKGTSNKTDKILATNLTKRNDKDLSVINFVTVRNDKRGSQQSETKHSNSEDLDSLPSYPDKNNKPNPQTSARSSRDLDKRIANSSKNDDKNNQVPNTDCSSQLQAVKKKTAVIVSESKNKKGNDEISSSSQHHQPSQIQSTIIEKLINDAVSYQFDGIRQQLYLQHASLCRTMNLRLDELEEQHAASNQSLLKVIQELLEENRVLRTAILAHQ